MRVARRYHRAVRTLKDLEANAINFWPKALADRERASSVIPLLIASQEKFISLLHVADKTPAAWKQILSAASALPGNLFLKHLMILCDVGGEQLDRHYTSFCNRKAFSTRTMHFNWRNAQHEYAFQSIGPARRWTNARLHVSGRGLAKQRGIDSAMEDVAMLLLFGGSATDADVPDEVTERCVLGSLIGRKDELEQFVRQRYIHVSRITGGAKANAMGQLCQEYVRERLANSLPGWDLRQHTIPGITQNAGKTDIGFDIVAISPGKQYCAIEVGFQVTTNSVFERKCGQAADRQHMLHKAGHRIAYVLDGAGNFRRSSALQTICDHSDYTSTLRDDELDKLADFLRKVA